MENPTVALTVRHFICKGCGNTGVGIDGKPCGCLLTPEWAKEVGLMRECLAIARADSQRRLGLLAALFPRVPYSSMDCHCYAGCSSYCSSHQHLMPCLFAQVKQELELHLPTENP